MIFQTATGQEGIKIFNALLIRDNRKIKKVCKVKQEQQILPLKIIKKSNQLIKINLGMTKMS